MSISWNHTCQFFLISIGKRSVCAHREITETGKNIKEARNAWTRVRPLPALMSWENLNNTTGELFSSSTCWTHDDTNQASETVIVSLLTHWYFYDMQSNYHKLKMCDVNMYSRVCSVSMPTEATICYAHGSCNWTVSHIQVLFKLSNCCVCSWWCPHSQTSFRPGFDIGLRWSDHKWSAL